MSQGFCVLRKRPFSLRTSIKSLSTRTTVKMACRRASSSHTVPISLLYAGRKAYLFQIPTDPVGCQLPYKCNCTNRLPNGWSEDGTKLSNPPPNFTSRCALSIPTRPRPSLPISCDPSDCLMSSAERERRGPLNPSQFGSGEGRSEEERNKTPEVSTRRGGRGIKKGGEMAPRLLRYAPPKLEGRERGG